MVVNISGKIIRGYSHCHEHQILLGVCMCVKLLQLCLTMCNPMDCSLSGSSLHEILQARILEWVAMPFSGALPDPWIKSKSPEFPALQVDSLQLAPPGKPPFRWHLLNIMIKWMLNIMIEWRFLLIVPNLPLHGNYM